MSRCDFLVETYRTERLKTPSVWSQIDGTVNGKSRRADFPYRRVARAGASAPLR